MILLLRGTEKHFEEPQFFCVRVPAVPAERDPHIGFSSRDQVQRFCEFHKIPSDTYEVVPLKPKLATSHKTIALFATDEDLDGYLKNPQAFRYERIIVPVLNGYASYIPFLLLRALARHA